MSDLLDPSSLLPPWRAAAPHEHRALAEQLRREVACAHPLYGKQAAVLARRDDRDDVLFYVKDSLPPYVVVHLTWRTTREEDQSWPQVQYFETLQRWCEDRMEPDHAEAFPGEDSN